MELLAAVLLWPLLLLVLGIVFISLSDWAAIGFFGWVVLLLGLGIFALSSLSKVGQQGKKTEQELATLRRIIIIFSIGLLAPVLVRYLFLTFQESLAAVLFGLVFGFALAIVGMFVKNNSVIAKASILGGALTLLYSYVQIWELGQGARIIAAATGLIVAVGISIAKLKDKLS